MRPDPTRCLLLIDDEPAQRRLVTAIGSRAGWWVRGASFGSLCWLALALPATLSLTLAGKVSVGTVASIASQWATTCIIAGLSCAWSWDKVT